jgi:broad specificity phosphatase PhoE
VARHGPAALVVRHAESTWNVAGLWQGWADPPLSSRGRRDAELATDGFRGPGWQAVHTSDLARARATADILAAGLGFASATADSRLRERDIGAWSGLRSEQIETRWPGALAAWRDGRLAAAPNGETVGQVLARMREALDILRQVELALVVSHSSALHALEGALGLTGDPAAHLSGRWIHADRGVLSAGEPFAAAGLTARSSHRP